MSHTPLFPPNDMRGSLAAAIVALEDAVFGGDPPPTIEVVTDPDTQIGQAVKIIGSTATQLNAASVTCFDNPFKRAVGLLVASNLVQTGGLVRGVLTDLLSGYTYVVGPDGRLAVAPILTVPGRRVFMQILGVALAEDVFFLAPTMEVRAYVS